MASRSFKRPKNFLGLILRAHRGPEAFQEGFGRGLRCALLEKLIFIWCPWQNQYFWRFIGPSKASSNRPQRLLWSTSFQTLILIIRKRNYNYKIVKLIQNIVICSVLNAYHGFWVALGTPFEDALEVKRAVIAVKDLLWNGFGTSLLDNCIFRGCP